MKRFWPVSQWLTPLGASSSRNILACAAGVTRLDVSPGCGYLCTLNSQNETSKCWASRSLCYYFPHLPSCSQLSKIPSVLTNMANHNNKPISGLQFVNLYFTCPLTMPPGSLICTMNIISSAAEWFPFKTRDSQPWLNFKITQVFKNYMGAHPSSWTVFIIMTQQYHRYFFILNKEVAPCIPFPARPDSVVSQQVPLTQPFNPWQALPSLIIHSQFLR